jgi:hypothetical protein
MSKNIQREILNRKPTGVDPVDFSAPTSLHVINRNRRDPAAEENSEEVKRFQKIANIYERHNYIKNQIELTKQEL